MSDRCYQPEEFDGLLELEPDDEGRAHLCECARCHGRLLAYEEFLRDRSVPPGADPADASAHLDAAFAQERHSLASQSLPDSAEGGSVAARGAPRAEAPGAARGLLEAAGRTLTSLKRPLRHPQVGWLPVSAAAAVVLIGVGMYGLLGWPPRPQGNDLLRSVPPSRGTEAAAFEIIEARISADGSIHVAWRPRAGADAYAVRLVDPEFETLAEFCPVTDAVLEIPAQDLASRGISGVPLAVQVVAFSQGQPNLVSSVQVLSPE